MTEQNTPIPDDLAQRIRKPREILSLEDRIDERPVVEYDPIIAVEQKWDAEEDQSQINDYWWDQRVSAELNHQKELEAQKAQRSRDWISEAYLEDHPSARSKATPPKPSQVHFKPSPEKIKEMAEAFKEMAEAFKPLAKQVKHVGKAAKKATETLEKFPATGSIAARGTHLLDRPVHCDELIALRESLAKNQ
jgi:cell pole-organizing protein PopZ